METIVDIIVVGAGPMGIAVGVEAQRANLSCLLIEKGALVDSLFNFPKNMQFFSTSEKLEIGDVPFMSNHEKPKRNEALEYYRRVVDKWSLNIQYYTEVTDVNKQEDGIFNVTTTKGIFKSKNVVIATGFYGLPNLLNIPGEELPKVSHYYDEPHPYINQKVVVIGAANSATQIALELFYKGAEVTMIVRENRIGDSVKYWIKPNIENRIAEGEIKAYFNANVTEIREKELDFEQNGKMHTIPNDFVLAMTGYHPDFEFLSKIGINCQTDDFQTPCHDTDNHETHIPGLYVAGVVCGGYNTSKYFIENSKEHADKIIGAIRSERD